MQPHVFLWHNLSNVETWHSKAFKCLVSLLPLMNLSHSFMVSLSKLSLSWLIHASLWIVNMAIELFIDLILSLWRALSAFLIICLPLSVFILLLSLTLTGIRSLLRHLRENLPMIWKICHFIFHFFPLSEDFYIFLSILWGNLSMDVSHSVLCM